LFARHSTWPVRAASWAAALGSCTWGALAVQESTQAHFLGAGIDGVLALTCVALLGGLTWIRATRRQLEAELSRLLPGQPSNGC